MLSIITKLHFPRNYRIDDSIFIQMHVFDRSTLNGSWQSDVSCRFMLNIQSNRQTFNIKAGYRSSLIYLDYIT